MNSWSPIFSKIIDSSIWCEVDHVRIVWITVLAKKASDHIVYGNAFNIHKWSNKSEAEVLDALSILSSPDTKRIEKQPFDGRRIEKVEGGWKILNGQVYEDEMRKLSRRAYQARMQREYRERNKQEAAEPKRKPSRKGKPAAGEALAMRAAENGQDTGEVADAVGAEMEANRADADGPAGLI